MVTVTLAASNLTPAHGETLSVTYTVDGNTGSPAAPPQTAQMQGPVTVGDQTLVAALTLTLPGIDAVPPLPETFAAPTCPGLSFQPTADPHVWTALVP